MALLITSYHGKMNEPTKPDGTKESPLWIFFGTVRLFFETISVAKGSPFEFFDILQHHGKTLTKS